MDERNVSQQYYIATESAPKDDRTRVLKYGATFAVFDRLGDIQSGGLGEHGIFCEGTRHLSQLVLKLWNERPLLLSSTIERDNFLFTADLANLDVSRGGRVVIHRDTLHLLRSRFLWRDSAYEELQFVNYGIEPLEVPLSIAIAADFADIFEIRGMRREKSGQQLPAEAGRDCLVLSYEGLDGVLRRTRIYFDPVPDEIAAGEMKLRLHLKSKVPTVLRMRMTFQEGQAVRNVSYTEAERRSGSEVLSAASFFPLCESSNSRFNDWLHRSGADVQMMTIGNAEKNYPYAGVPWFSTVFGRDGIITALETLWANPSIAAGVLSFLASTQATFEDNENEAEPGKILHELRHGEMANLKEIPFARYYGTVDATPLFVMLAGEYYERTGDLELIHQLWPNIQAALRWIDEFGDVDKDGFVEYAAHGRRGLIQQGWKDSRDSVFHADGSLAEPPIALCEVQGYVYAAKLAAARLSDVLGDPESCRRLDSEAARLRERFHQAFWCEDLGVYAIALDGRKRPCKVRASNAGHCLYTGVANAENARELSRTLFEHDFFSGWGIRTLASNEVRYNPLSYHNGSVWPHDNALIAHGLARYGFKKFAGKLLLSFLDAASAMELHRLPELFCGLERNREGEAPVLYPVACSPQAWSAAAPYLLIQSCLGLHLQGAQKRVFFDRPCLPEGIRHLSIHGLKVNGSSVDLLFERQEDTVRVQVLEKQGELDVVATL